MSQENLVNMTKSMIAACTVSFSCVLITAVYYALIVAFLDGIAVKYAHFKLNEKVKFTLLIL